MLSLHHNSNNDKQMNGKLRFTHPRACGTELEVGGAAGTSAGRESAQVRDAGQISSPAQRSVRAGARKAISIY
jgi:hypothetical protein